MGAATGDARKCITRFSTTKLMLFLIAPDSYPKWGRELGALIRASDDGQQKRVVQASEGKDARKWMKCVVGLKCLHTWYH